MGLSFEDILNSLHEDFPKPKYEENPSPLPQKIMADIPEGGYYQKFKAFDNIFISEDHYDSQKEEIIDLSHLAGTFKPTFKSIHNDFGLGTMYTMGANKMETIYMYESRDKYKNFLLDDCPAGLPEVTKYKNEYYIDGNGNHRLMLAKLLGLSKAKAIVRTLNRSGKKFLEQKGV